MAVVKSPWTTPITECGDSLLLKALLFETEEELETLKAAFLEAAKDPDRLPWLVVAHHLFHATMMFPWPGALVRRGPFLMTQPELRRITQPGLRRILEESGGAPPEFQSACDLSRDPTISRDEIAAALGATVDSWLTWAAMYNWEVVGSPRQLCPDESHHQLVHQGRPGSSLAKLAEIRVAWSMDPPTDDPLLKERLRNRGRPEEVPQARAADDYRRAIEAVIADTLQAAAPTRMVDAEKRMWARIREGGIERYVGPYWWDAATANAVVGDDRGDWWQLPAPDVRCHFYFGISPAAPSLPAVWAREDVVAADRREGEYSPDDLALVGVGGVDDYGAALWRERSSGELVGWSKAYSVGEVQRMIEARTSIVIRNDLDEVAKLDADMRRMLRHELTL